MEKLIEIFDLICAIGIQLGWDMAEIFQKTYGFITIVACFFIEPIAVVLFMIASIWFMLRKNKLNRIIGTIFFSLGILLCAAVMIPVIYTLVVR